MFSQIFLPISLLVQAPVVDTDLTLVCSGSGIAKVQTGTSANAYDNYGNSIRITGTRADLVEYSSITDFQLKGDVAQIRLPRPLLPTLRGGSDGWFKVKKLKVSANEISGKAAVNFINNPDFSINRYTGVLSVNSKNGSFSGRCKAIDESTERKF